MHKALILIVFCLLLPVASPSPGGHMVAFTRNTSAQPYQNATANATASEFAVIVSSTFPGQLQQLSLPENLTTGYLMYPVWSFRFFSHYPNASYKVFINGVQVGSSSFVFSAAMSQNISAETANVSVILQSGSHVQAFNWVEVPILHTTLLKYYSSQLNERPVYTVTQYLDFGLREIGASILVLLAAYLIVYRTYVTRKERETVEV